MTIQLILYFQKSDGLLLALKMLSKEHLIKTKMTERTFTERDVMATANSD